MRDVWGYGNHRTRTLDSHVISSTVSGVGCVGCGFRPARRRRFISSGVDSALAAELSPEGEATWRGRGAPSDHPVVTIDSLGFLSYCPSGRVAGWAGGVDGARR